jgi:hypothetical protein
MSSRHRGHAAFHAVVIAAVMDHEGLNQVDVVCNANAAGRFVSVDTLQRALVGSMPNTRSRAAIAAGISNPAEGRVISSRELFGGMPLPAWVAQIMYGTPAAGAMAVAA